jgi:hypothetical protein
MRRESEAKKMAESWTEQFNQSSHTWISPVPAGRKRMIPGQKMLYPSAQTVDETVRKIPRGTSIDRRTLREQMADAYEAEVTCPVTTAKMMRIVAEHAIESLDRGTPVEMVTPFWRAMDPKASEAKRLSRGADFVASMRAAEGLK